MNIKKLSGYCANNFIFIILCLSLTSVVRLKLDNKFDTQGLGQLQSNWHREI